MKPYIGQTVIVHAPQLKSCCRPAVIDQVLDDEHLDLSLLSGAEIGLEFKNVPVIKSAGGNGDAPAEWTLTEGDQQLAPPTDVADEEPSDAIVRENVTYHRDPNIIVRYGCAYVKGPTPKLTAPTA